MAQLLLALEFLQSEGIVHRDVKPENVLLSENGYIKLTDFGLAQHLEYLSHHRRGEALGTVFYMAPEVLRHQEYSYPVDWYAVGIMMYEMLTGAPPFVGKSASSHYQIIFQPVVHLTLTKLSLYPSHNSKKEWFQECVKSCAQE